MWLNAMLQKDVDQILCSAFISLFFSHCLQSLAEHVLLQVLTFLPDIPPIKMHCCSKYLSLCPIRLVHENAKKSDGHTVRSEHDYLCYSSVLTWSGIWHVQIVWNALCWVSNVIVIIHFLNDLSVYFSLIITLSDSLSIFLFVYFLISDTVKV